MRVTTSAGQVVETEWEDAEKHRMRLRAFEAELKAEFPQLERLVLQSGTGGSLHIAAIRVRQDQRGNGIGRAVLDRVKKFARELGVPVTLEPEADLGKRAALERFYRSNDFQHNRGRHADHSYGGLAPTMIWKPDSNQESAARGVVEGRAYGIEGFKYWVDQEGEVYRCDDHSDYAADAFGLPDDSGDGELAGENIAAARAAGWADVHTETAYGPDGEETVFVRVPWGGLTKAQRESIKAVAERLAAVVVDDSGSGKPPEVYDARGLRTD